MVSSYGVSPSFCVPAAVATTPGPSDVKVFRKALINAQKLFRQA